jgi:hypothetical protein
MLLRPDRCAPHLATLAADAAGCLALFLACTVGLPLLLELVSHAR